MKFRLGSSKRLFTLAGLLSLVVVTAVAQRQSRVVEWQPHPFGLITRVGEE